MSKKSPAIAALIESCKGRSADPYYLGYFECFNRQLFFEAHDVLEELWLKDKLSPNYRFYKGLIQYAGAFVHLQKNRLRPSAALFKLARTNIAQYPALHERLDTSALLVAIEGWLERLEQTGFSVNPLTPDFRPALVLIEPH
jgi:predicted metal-dependent hydrolase